MIKTFKDYDNDSNLTQIGWCLSTLDEHGIRMFATEDGVETDSTFWDDVNSSIDDFESVYEDILKKYVTACRNEGHDSNDALVGSAWVTDEQIEWIKNNSEFVCDGTYILKQSSGYFDCDELDLLNHYVLADLEFYNIPEETRKRDKSLSPKIEDLVPGKEYLYFDETYTSIDEYLTVKYSHFDGTYYIFMCEGGDGEIELEFSEFGISEYIEEM